MARIMQLKIVKFIKLILEQNTLHGKYSTLKEKIVIVQSEIDRKRKEITEIESKLPSAKEKPVTVKKVHSVQNIGLPPVKAVPAVRSPNVTSSAHQKAIIKVPEVPKARDLTKSLLFSPLEMTHIELPQLKLPVFNSPPRKVQRTSRPVVRPVRLFPEYSFQEKEPCTEDRSLECPGNEVIPMEVNTEANKLVATSEMTTFQDQMEVEGTQDMEQVSSTFSSASELTQSQEQQQHTGKQGEEEQSQVMHQQGHEQRQEEHSLLLQDLQTSEQMQQHQQEEEHNDYHHQQQQPLQQQCFWEQQQHQQDENDAQRCESEAVTEHGTEMQTEDEPVGEMRSCSQPLSENSDICDMRPLSQDESFDSTSERARREFLSKVTKSPEFTFIPRKDLDIEEVDKADDVQIDTRSQYFLNPLQSCSEQRTVTEQARQQEPTKQQNAAPQGKEPEFPESTESFGESQEHAVRGISPRGKETNMESSDDLLAVSFHSLSPPDAICLSPPSSQAPGPTGNQGFMFSFAPQSSGSIMSLFGEGEPNQEQEESGTQQKKNEAFTFTFDKKTKSSSFFKLF